jgi:hypothetical protein
VQHRGVGPLEDGTPRARAKTGLRCGLCAGQQVLALRAKETDS